MNRQTSIAVAMFVFLVALGTTARVISGELETWNFTPSAAVALFAGFYFSPLAVAAAVPVLVMMASNYVMYGNRPFLGYEYWQMMVVVYIALLIPLLFRWMLRSGLSVPRVLVGTVSSALLFFAVTNFAHWYYQVEPHTVDTLVQTYVVALPFFRGTLMGDLVFSAMLFGGYALAARFGQAAEMPAAVAVRK